MLAIREIEEGLKQAWDEGKISGLQLAQYVVAGAPCIPLAVDRLQKLIAGVKQEETE